ncbi:hypothetical protein [Weissella cibaria]|uniref:hypothetical protein n=1 Tax=Weissella cibaria TaxID=137591 RepID=UPI00106EAEE2|nr:hypothetical protein [Weissella cibaria]
MALQSALFQKTLGEVWGLDEVQVTRVSLGSGNKYEATVVPYIDVVPVAEPIQKNKTLASGEVIEAWVYPVNYNGVVLDIKVYGSKKNVPLFKAVRFKELTGGPTSGSDAWINADSIVALKSDN